MKLLVILFISFYSCFGFAYSISQTHNLYFDLDQRLKFLHGLPKDRAKTFCLVPFQSKDDIRPFIEFKNAGTYDTDSAGEPLAWKIMSLTSDYLRLQDEEILQNIVKILKPWAVQDAAREYEIYQGDQTDSLYSARRLLLPLLVSWSIVSEKIKTQNADYKQVDSWLMKFAERVNQEDKNTIPNCKKELSEKDSFLSDCNNHRLLKESVRLLSSLLWKNEKVFDSAIHHVEKVLDTQRKDGSLPYETARGGRALWYQRQALASLEVISQLLKQQNIKWSYVNSIEQGSRFLFSAIQNPKLVNTYAKLNIMSPYKSSPTSQYLGFLNERPHHRHYMAWLENTASQAELESLVAKSRPLVDEFSGGNMSCFFATK